MGDRFNSERLRGFCDRWTDRQTFVILELLLCPKIPCSVELLKEAADFYVDQKSLIFQLKLFYI